MSDRRKKAGREGGAMSEQRLSAAELQRRGERAETARQLIYDLADRVYAWSLDQEQEADILVLARARALGWRPWHERLAGREGEREQSPLS